MIVLLGSSGMIGKALHQKLLAQGLTVWAPDRHWLTQFESAHQHNDIDNLRDYEPELLSYFTPETIVINALGAAPGLGEVVHRRVYERAISILKYAVFCNVAKIINLSALSHYAHPNEIPYLKYKYQLDSWLQKSHPLAYIVRSSLVFSEQGKSTQFFQRLTKLPALMLPKSRIYASSLKTYEVMPIHIDDLTAFMMALMTQDLPVKVYEVGGEILSIADYLRCFNPKLKIFWVPEWVLQLSMICLGIFIQDVAGKYSYRLLRAGSSSLEDHFFEVMKRPVKMPLFKN